MPYYNLYDSDGRFLQCVSNLMTYYNLLDSDGRFWQCVSNLMTSVLSNWDDFILNVFNDVSLKNNAISLELSIHFLGLCQWNGAIVLCRSHDKMKSHTPRDDNGCWGLANTSLCKHLPSPPSLNQHSSLSKMLMLSTETCGVAFLEGEGAGTAEGKPMYCGYGCLCPDCLTYVWTITCDSIFP